MKIVKGRFEVGVGSDADEQRGNFHGVTASVRVDAFRTEGVFK